jgi:hypothetical protein
LFAFEVLAQSACSLIWNVTCKDGSYHLPFTGDRPMAASTRYPATPAWPGHVLLRLAATWAGAKRARLPVTAAALRTG